jgi:dipeptidyl aminopeptidase/acylaminoacyl peptidase
MLQPSLGPRYHSLRQRPALEPVSLPFVFLANPGSRGAGRDDDERPLVLAVRGAHIDALRLPAAAFLAGLLSFMLVGCGGGGEAPAQDESWASGWRKDSPKPPVADDSVYADWATVDEYPAWSPDGRWVAFDSTRAGGGIYVVHPNGRGLRRVWKGSSSAYPAWSPDGRRLAFATREGIRSVRLDGSAPHLLARHENAEQVRWSPDGRVIAFGVSSPSSIDIYVTRVSGARARRVARSRIGFQLQSFDWSPTGRELLVQVGGRGVATLNLRSGFLRFVRNGSVDYGPASSTTGAEVAYECAGEICTIGRNGNGERVLTAVNGATEPAWSPDGRWIVFSRAIYGYTYAENPQALYRVSADGRHLRNITFGPTTRSTPAKSRRRRHAQGGHAFS